MLTNTQKLTNKYFNRPLFGVFLIFVAIITYNSYFSGHIQAKINEKVEN